MKINKPSADNNIERVRTVSSSGRLIKPEGTFSPTANQPVAPDSVSISSRASSRAEVVGKSLEKIAELPDVRQERVAALKALIDGGSYRPSGEDIANAIIRDEKK
jgi:negative regulator of flagellin synthesis FlgM